MIPHEFLAPYLASNAVALLILVIAFWRPQVTRVLGVLIFAAAAIVNPRLAMFNPAEYVQYGA